MISDILKEIEGLKVLLIFEDGRSGASRKGVIRNIGEYFIFIESPEHGREFIPIKKIIRINLESDIKR